MPGRGLNQRRDGARVVLRALLLRTLLRRLAGDVLEDEGDGAVRLAVALADPTPPLTNGGELRPQPARRN